MMEMKNTVDDGSDVVCGGGRRRGDDG